MSKTEILTLFIGVVGALAWFSPWLYEKLTRPDLEIKLISQYGSIGSVKTHEINISKGNLYLMKFAIASKNKGFDYKNINVKLKLPSNANIVDGHVYIGRNSYYTSTENNKPVLKKLVINQEEELLYNCYMEKDKPLIGYLSFAIDTAIDENYEKLILEFERFNGKKIVKEISSNDIKGSTLFYEEKIWTDVSEDEIQKLEAQR